MRSTKQHRDRAAWSVETLEGRLLLNGDVTASLQNGNVSVAGDTEANEILISQPSPGTIHIEGLEGTTVNGQASVDLPGVTGGLTILMDQGNEDRAAVQGPFDLRGTLRAKLDL